MTRRKREIVNDYSLVRASQMCKNAHQNQNLDDEFSKVKGIPILKMIATDGLAEL